MNSRTWAWAVVCTVTVGCAGSSVTVSGLGEDGKITVNSQGGALPPVEALVSDKGIEPAPTMTPGQPTPVHPIDTPAPPATPAPISTPRPS